MAVTRVVKESVERCYPRDDGAGAKGDVHRSGSEELQMLVKSYARLYDETDGVYVVERWLAETM